MLLAAVATAYFLATCVVLGPPLMVRGVRERAMPEVTLSIVLIGCGVLGLPPQVVARIIEGDAPGTAAGLQALGLAFGTLGMLCLCAFTWRLFRPESKLCAAIAGGLSLLIVVTLAEQLVQVGLRSDVPVFWRTAAMLVRLAVFVWTGAECLAYYRRLAKQQALGLAKPLVVDRFRMVAIASFSIAAVCMVAIVMDASSIRPRDSVPMSLAFSLPLFLAPTATWLVVAPPAAYRRYLEARPLPNA